MKHLWWKLAFPIDRDLCLSDEEKIMVWKRAQVIRYPGFLRKNVLLTFTGLLFALFFFLFLDWLKDWINQFAKGWATLPFIILFFTGNLYFSAVLVRIFKRSSLYRALREHGYDVCLKCGYWLKELPLEQSKHCPECGWEREPLSEVQE